MDAHRALEKFIIENPNLEGLEDLLVDFNVFEVLGIEKSETRHSAFLAWLMDPNGNHGLDDYWLLKLNAGGDTIWTKTLGGSDYDFAYSVQQTADEGFIVAGYTRSNDGDVSGNHGWDDFWIIKLSLLTFVDESENDIYVNFYPNPAQAELIIESSLLLTNKFSLSIFNVIGELISKQELTLSDKQAINVKRLIPGVYFIKMVAEDKEHIHFKFIKIE